MPVPIEILELIRRLDRHKDKAADSLDASADSLERQFIRATLSMLSNLSTTGENARLSQANMDKVQRLKRKLQELIASGSDFGKTASSYLSSMNGVLPINRQIYSKMGYELPPDFAEAITTTAIDNLNSALGRGMEVNVVEPYIRKVTNMVSVGANVNEIEDEISKFLEGAGSIERYIGQISTDSINQYDGLLSERIGKELELEWVVYAGSIIDTSRKQCRRWTETRYLHRSEFRDEIRWAERNGSGMIPGTTAATFTTNRGGYRCRHKATYISTELVPASARARIQ